MANVSTVSTTHPQPHAAIGSTSRRTVDFGRTKAMEAQPPSDQYIEGLKDRQREALGRGTLATFLTISVLPYASGPVTGALAALGLVGAVHTLVTLAGIRGKLDRALDAVESRGIASH